MRRKDISEDPGIGRTCEPGTHPVLYCNRRNEDSGPSEDLPLSGRCLHGSKNSFCTRSWKRKRRHQRYRELFRRFLEHQTIYDWHTASFRGRNNYCKTDLEATFMHMKDDHMRNA